MHVYLDLLQGALALSTEQVGQDVEALNSVAFNVLSPFRVWSHLVEDFDNHSWSGRGRGHATIYSTGYTSSVHYVA
jgi:hypothetical protein